MILVIKKPPLDAPSIVLGNTLDEENNIEEKFVSFSYRYKYLDGNLVLVLHFLPTHLTQKHLTTIILRE